MPTPVSRIERKESLESKRRAGTASSLIAGLVAMESWLRECLSETRRKTLIQCQQSGTVDRWITHASFEIPVLFKSKVESLGRCWI